MSVYAKLGKIQAELKAPKGQYNSFGKYNYRSCEDILEAAKPLVKSNACVLVLSDEITYLGDRYYIKATATLIDAETGEQASNTAYAREEKEKKGMDGSQITGTASSYARKYALNGLFCIDDARDADTDEYTKAVNGPAKGIAEAQPSAIFPEGVVPPTKSQLAEMKRLGMDINKVAKYYGCEPELLDADEVAEAIEKKRAALTAKKVGA